MSLLVFWACRRENDPAMTRAMTAKVNSRFRRIGFLKGKRLSADYADWTYSKKQKPAPQRSHLVFLVLCKLRNLWMCILLETKPADRKFLGADYCIRDRN